MARPVISNPLAGAAPQLQPTARPKAVQIGATPEPRRSPLMELAQAFDGFVPELHAGLRSVAAQQDHDAMASGELAAMKANAAARMGELDGLIKQGVDAGTFPAVRAPAFERGFRSRVGQDLAQSLFQEKLLATVPDATKVSGRLDPEKAIADTYAEISKQIHPDDFYARQAFDATAQGVIAGYRQRVDEGYTAAYKAAGEQTMADQGSELVLHLGSAADVDAPLIRTAVKEHLDEMRRELPSDQVNPFFVKNIVGPAVDKLVSQQKFTDARHLLDEMDNLDVTGKGGLLGQTAVGKAAFSDMRAKVERETRASQYEAYTRLRQDRELKQGMGDQDAGDALQQLRLANSGHLPQNQRFKLIDDYRKKYADDSQRVEGFAAAVQNEFSNEDRFRADPKALSGLETSLDTLHKEDLDKASSTLETLYNLGSIAPSDRTRVAEKIKKLQTLYGAIDEQDINRFKKDLYAQPGIGGQKTINFGDSTAVGPTSSSSLWDKLTDSQKAQHELEVSDFFYSALQDQIRAIGDPNKIPAEKAGALDRATLKAQEFARNRLRDLSGLKQKQEDAVKVQKQKTALRTAAVTSGFYRSPTFDGYEPPDNRKGFAHMAYLGYRGPDPERDKVDIYFPAHTVGEWFKPGPAGATRDVDLNQLAKDIQENPDDNMAQKAKDTYAYVKGRLGFTPDEILNGVTKHGVPFSAKEIDPKFIAVFRNRAELEKEWNNGQPTPKFLSVGDTLDPRDAMTPAQFYLAQLALFNAHQ